MRQSSDLVGGVEQISAREHLVGIRDAVTVAVLVEVGVRAGGDLVAVVEPVAVAIAEWVRARLEDLEAVFEAVVVRVGVAA